MVKSNDSLSYTPITMLVLLMALLYSVFMAAMIPQALNFSLPDGTVQQMYPSADIVNLVVVNVFFCMLVLSFLKATFTKTGFVPDVHPWDPSAAVDEKVQADLVRGFEKKIDGRPRFCRRCGKFKPDRTHHSSSMGACVLEMDHYCPWIRNCVGFYNKKYFFLLIFYGCLTGVSYCVALGSRFVYSCQHLGYAIDFFVVVCWLITLFIATALTVFTIFHIWLMSLNFTTIEFCEKRLDGKKRTTSDGIQIKTLYERSPYDFGVYNNICHTLGPFYLWLIPTRYGMQSEETSGCIYPMNPKHPLYRTTYRISESKMESSDDPSASLLSH